MKRSKRGQVILEYLVTYGWGILVVIIGVSVLVYFGFLSPANLLPNTCDFGAQLVCQEFRIIQDPSGGHIDLQLRNDFGRDIEIHSVEGVDKVLTPITTLPLLIPKKAVMELQIATTFPIQIREKAQIPMILEFARNDTGAPRHNLTGEVFAIVQ